MDRRHIGGNQRLNFTGGPLPASAVLLDAFVIFFVTVKSSKRSRAQPNRAPIETWMKLVIAATVAFLLA
jgi:hypothetical protein